MTSRRPRRAALATGLSLILHVAALTGMVIGLKVARPPPDSRTVELELIPAPPLRPEPAHKPAERGHVALPLRPHQTPAPSPDTPIAALPETPNSAPAPKTEAGPQSAAGFKGLSPSLSGRTGCDDALGFHMTPAQRQVCADKLARLAQNAQSLDINIPNQQRSAYDRYSRCRDFFHNEPVVPPSQQVTETGTHFTPADANKCPMADRF